MASTPSPSNLRDVPEENRFLYEEDGVQAELVYSRNGKRLTLIHTGVPESLGGRGVGAQLVQAALGRAKAESLTVVPLCPYAARWISDHPGDAAGVEVDWGSQRPRDTTN